MTASRTSFQAALLVLVIAPFMTFAACQSGRSGPGAFELAASDSATQSMERVFAAASTCWFKSNDRSFSAYRLAPEHNSFSGRPRILIVSRRAPETRPLAVIQAEGNPARVEIFGPLLDQPVGNRISRDITRWVASGTSCSA